MTEQTYTDYRLDPDYRFDTLDQKVADLSSRSADDGRQLKLEIADLSRNLLSPIAVAALVPE